MPEPTWPAILLVLCGPAVGSFLAVLVDRLPRGEDVLRRPSACRACGRRLAWRDLVPLLSFAAARGMCRTCGAAIPAWHLYLEIAAAGLAVLAVLAGGGGAAMWLAALILWCLLALAAADLLWFRLPDALTLALALLALARAGFGLGGPDLAQAFAGGLLGAGTFWLLRAAYARLRRRDGMGLGDVKLIAGLGALAGPELLASLVLGASLLALAAALVAAMVRRAPLDAAARVPFGAALCAAAFGLWVWQAASA